MKPTVGEQLRAARNSRGISLTDAVKATHIRSRFLQELENDHPELLDSTVQARGFLRLYAEYLGLSFADLLSDWESDKEPQNTVAEKVSLTTEEERGADAIEPPADSPKQTEG